MTGGVVAAAMVAHVPTLGRAENTPDYQQTLVQAERTMGAAVRKVRAPFDPEGGAYGQHNHDPGQRHGPLHEDRHG